MTSTNAYGSEEFDIKLKGDGFEVKPKEVSDESIVLPGSDQHIAPAFSSKSKAFIHRRIHL